MATKKKAGQETKAAEGGMLQEAAKIIGSTVGAIAKKTGLAEAPPKKRPKLAKKDKSGLPRKEKKKAQKAAVKKKPTKRAALKPS